MDLYSMYLPDALSYTSFRSPAYYRDYETQPFDDKKRNCHYKEKQQPNQQSSAHAQHNHGNQGTNKQQQRRESCPFCKEDKRRPLGAYLRSKGTSDHKDSITEEEEEQKHGEETQQTKRDE
ncbi:uncharacterized protein LOC113373157 [Ctenocephalides felis]|uniref:uncharacterized protein LOC113373157 n=1 Tax=Ctenocephalides felis TaxID=7515 RepID=UPI000E6E49BF|nr:uncharacterized protein LOC113373157 [Ctenocephalides felis]